eukprot:492358_1
MNSNAPIHINTSMTTLATTSSHSASITSPPNLSPITPICDAMQRLNLTSPTAVSRPYSIRRVMVNHGYIPSKCLASTLQGSIWKVRHLGPDTRIMNSVIKVAQKALHEKNIAIVDGKEFDVQENIIKETAILRYLTNGNPPDSLVKFESFFSDKHNFFLVMEDAGDELFGFVVRAHKFIRSGQLSIKEWRRFCKRAARQMVELVDWMHNEMNCCHLDISLENFTIQNALVYVNENNGNITFTDDFVIKMVDFGLAEVFTSATSNGKVGFECTKYVGKMAYKAREVYKKRPFDARAADVWSLGVAICAMLTGGMPFQKASQSDYAFSMIMNGEMVDLLKRWNKAHHVTPSSVDLLQRIFVKEKSRINIEDIKKHPWFV